MKKLCIASVLLGIFWWGSLHAQNEEQIKIKCFMSKVILQQNDSKSYLLEKTQPRGWLYYADDDTLVLLVKDLKKNDRLNPTEKMQIRIPAENIKKIRIWKRSRVYKGMAIGGIPMAILGASLSYNFSVGIYAPPPTPEPGEVLLGGLIFGAVGGGIGALIASGTYKRKFQIKGNLEAYKHARTQINDRFAIQPQLNP